MTSSKPNRWSLNSITPSPERWSSIKSTSKKGFDKVYVAVDKLGAPVNKLTNKIGSEAFWPTTLDKESDKAARILRSFARDGFVTEEKVPSKDKNGVVSGPTAKQNVLKKIPAEVIAKAKGLAIFTTMRTGLWISGAGGSGVLIARMADGSWSPPSGILLHTAGLGFLVGVDIYDCVVVLNTTEAVQAFTNPRFTLGGEFSAVAGPVGAGGILESNLRGINSKPVFSYLKSRGFYAGVQIDGTVIIERGDENEKFYGERIKVGDILAGKAKNVPVDSIKLLMNTLRMAEGRSVREDELPQGQAPGELQVAAPHLPGKEEIDPYGLAELEAQGVDVHVAGSNQRVSEDMVRH